LRTLVELAAAEGISLIFDAAHAFGSRYPSRFVGLGGAAEVFSFHATKFLNAFEGGAIATRDDELASRARDMVNFGFRGYDDVRSVGTNAKMTEVSAAMGLTSLEAETSIRQHNVEIWQAYSDALDATEFLRLMRYPSDEENSHQYVVVEVLSGAPLSRDLLVRLLHAEGCLARRYFYPGVHRMQPYSALNPMADRWLPVTLELCRSVLVLPTGTAVTPGDAVRVVTLMLEGFRRADVVRNVLGEAIQGG
jgi:dTDP-4-amino-4,6-dideoxygalactose transaminase